ncbi:7271_t:CDS:2, partial [Paraglomus occultum]
MKKRDKAERKLDEAKGEFDEAKEQLKEFEGDEDSGQLLKALLKRFRRDQSAEVCELLSAKLPSVPNITTLQSIFQLPFLSKLPVIDDLYLESPFDKYLSSSDNGAKDLAIHISYVLNSPVLASIGSAVGEDMLRGPIDLIVRNFVMLFREKLATDFLCWLNDVLILKGEEKASQSEFDAACEELRS